MSCIIKIIATEHAVSQFIALRLENCNVYHDFYDNKKKVSKMFRKIEQLDTFGLRTPPNNAHAASFGHEVSII